MRYEHRGQPPLSRRAFAGRLLRHIGFAGALVGGSVVVGTAGYHWLAGETWIDGFVNACMLLGGMGQIGDLSTTSGKIFAALFALYAGLLFLVSAAAVLTPILHRVMHTFHWDAEHKGQASNTDDDD